MNIIQVLESMYQAPPMVMLEDKLLSRITHISMLILEVAIVATQDFDFIAVQIRLQVILVPSLILIDQFVQVTFMI